jgi:glycosyltransferase involved in cell wall biosynthesis
MKAAVSVVVLSFNEEKNIAECLESVHGWADEIVVVDSFSTDRTIEIAARYTDRICQHPFENYARQRNWALETIALRNEWILNLDADYRVTPELREEIGALLESGVPDSIKGFLISRRTIFMNRWMRHGGHYPLYYSGFFRKGCGSCEDRLYDQHFVIAGDVGVLKGDVLDVIADSLARFTERHNRWSSLEAVERLGLLAQGQRTVAPKITGHKIEKRRFMLELYYRFPPFVRPLVYFLYRYVLRAGFRDGVEGLIFQVLHAVWFRFLVDAKIREIRMRARREGRPETDVVQEMYGTMLKGED